MENTINIRFLSKRCNISIIRNMIGVMLVENNPTLTFINELKTVVSEAITNSIVHGYENKEDNYVELKINTFDDKICIDVKDDGVGIVDVEQAKEALFSTKHDEERSGLGFTIMELFSDELKVESKVGVGTLVHIEKHW